MIIVHHLETGESRTVDPVDARELIETGRWSKEGPRPAKSPTVDLLNTADKGVVPGGSNSTPCPPTGRVRK